MIEAVEFVWLPVADMARARAFYEETLGLRVGMVFEDLYTEYDLGSGPAVGLLNVAKRGLAMVPSVTGSVAIAFHKVEQVAEAVKARSLLPKPLHSGEMCDAGFAQDTEGNAVVLHRRKQEQDRDHLVDFVSLPIEDMGRAQAFYEGVLGLKPGPVHGDQWTEYELPDGSTFALGDVRAMGQEFAPVTAGSVGFRVDTLEDTFAKLREAGQALQPELQETKACTMGFVRDSEGNSLVLHRAK